MALIVRIAVNTKEIRCYSIRRITHTDKLKPHCVCQYEIRDIHGTHMGDVYHHYDDAPEQLVLLAMLVILSGKK